VRAEPVERTGPSLPGVEEDERCPFLHPADAEGETDRAGDVECGVRLGRRRVPSREELGWLCRLRFRSCPAYRVWREITKGF
jgi:hypothetical protein